MATKNSKAMLIRINKYAEDIRFLSAIAINLSPVDLDEIIPPIIRLTKKIEGQCTKFNLN